MHIVNNHGGKSPSAFIPFCSFGEDINIMGAKIEDFDLPVCNTFNATVLLDQVCYEVDLDSYKDKTKIENQLKYGLILILDYNEYKQLDNEQKNQPTNLFVAEDENTVNIHLDTISNKTNYFYFKL